MALSQLGDARQRAGLSQQAAAVRLGVSQPYYSQLEGGTRPLVEELAARAVNKLGPHRASSRFLSFQLPGVLFRQTD